MTLIADAHKKNEDQSKLYKLNAGAESAAYLWGR